MNPGTLSQNEKTDKDRQPGCVVDHYHVDLSVPRIVGRRILVNIAIEPNNNDRETGTSGQIFSTAI
jgi:hypothetical protein